MPSIVLTEEINRINPCKSMRLILLAVFSGSALLLTGCSSTWQYVKSPDQSMNVADTSKARIYLIRPDSGGKMTSTRISDNGVLIGNTGPRSYLCWEREPGTMKVTSVSAGEATTELTVAAGKVYYILQLVDAGWVYGKSSVTLVPEQAALPLLKSCKPAYITQAEPTWKKGRTSMDAVNLVARGGPAGSGGAVGTVGSAGGIVIIMRGRGVH